MYPKMASFASSITNMPGAKSPFEDAGAAVDQRRCLESKDCPCCCIVCRPPADGCRTDKCRQLRSVTENAEHSVTMPAAERRKIFILKCSIVGKMQMFQFGAGECFMPTTSVIWRSSIQTGGLIGRLMYF